MSRNIQVSLPSEHTNKLLQKIQNLDGLIGLRVHRNVSLQPKGDVLDFDLINPEVNNFLLLMEKEGLLNNEEVSVTTNQPTSILSRSSSEKILTESHETSWEDVLKNLLHESNMSFNTQVVMFISGIIAAIGISTNTLHVVIGAMLIAPGFEPVSRLAMGLVTKHRDWKRGGMDILKGYGVLIIGAIVGGLIVKILDKDVIPGTSSYLPAGVLPEYWTSITATSVLVSIVAAVAGGIIIMTNKSLLTAGVMVALALIPAATLIGLGLIEANYALMGTAFIRLLLELLIVAICTGAVFLWKRNTTHKRNMQI